MVALAIACACSANVNDEPEARASPDLCIEQCVAADLGECESEPTDYLERCSADCVTEAEMQPACCVDLFHEMWECRIREMVGICDDNGEPVTTYDGRCVAESESYSECFAG